MASERRPDRSADGGGPLPASELPPEVAAAVDRVVDRKGREPMVLDLRGLSSATDFFLIASGTSDVHVKSMAEHVIDALKRDGVRASHVEGLQGGRWVLIDYIDFVVHLFHPEARAFYQLETLWGDAPSFEPGPEP